MGFGYSGYYLCRSNFSIVLPQMIQDLAAQGMSINDAKIQLGSVVSLSVLGYALAKFFSGPISEWVGGRRGFLIGMFGSIIFTVLFSLGGSIPFFTLAAIGNRLFQSMGWINVVKISSRWFSYSSYGSIMGILSLSYMFGDAAARKILSYFLDFNMDWRTIYLLSAGILCVLFLANLFFLKESPNDIGEPEPPENKSSLIKFDEHENSNTSVLSIFKILLSNRTFVLICVLSLGCTLVREAFSTWVALYYTEIGYDTVRAASSSAWFPLFGGISVFIAGFISDRLGYNGRALILSYGLLCTTLLLFILGFVKFGYGSRWEEFLISLIAFALIGPYSYLGGAMALDIGGKRGSAIASGMIDGVGYIGGFLSGGTLARVTVSFGWSGTFYTLAGVAFLSFLAAVYYLVEQKKLLISEEVLDPA